MRKLLPALVALSMALTAACSGGAGSSGAAFAPAGAAPIISAKNLHPLSPYEFWFYNDDATATLHVWNTYGGNCTLNQLPRTELAHGASWSGVLHTKDDGWCAISSKEQNVLLWFNHDIDTGNYIELDYFKRFGSQSWHVQKIGGSGGFTGVFKEAPIRTRCQRNGNGLIVCSVS